MSQDVIRERIERWARLQEFIHPIPELWLREAEDQKIRNATIQTEECTSWESLVGQWERGFVFADYMAYGLVCSLATILSTKLADNQLWMKIMSVPSGGKTEIAEAVSTCRKYVYPKDRINKFYSGTRNADGKDSSIIVKVKNRTLVTKDGDTLIKHPDKEEILSQARGLYDKSGRVHFNNNVEFSYENVVFTWLLFGTNSLRDADHSELGERFLDCSMLDRVNKPIERRIIDHILSPNRPIGLEVDGVASEARPPQQALAFSLTGGYVQYLRENVGKVFAGYEYNHKAYRMLGDLAIFTSHMRTKLGKGKDAANVNREMAGRLASQFKKLAECVAGVMGEHTLSPRVMSYVKRVALDTSWGKCLDIVRYLYKSGENGSEPKNISLTINQSEERTWQYLHHLRYNDVIEPHRTGFSKRWRIHPQFAKLYREITR